MEAGRRGELEALFRDWARGEWSTTPPWLAPGVQFSAAQPEGQVRATGPDGIAAFMRGFLARWELYAVEISDIEEVAESRFLAVGTQHGKGVAGGVDITAPVFVAIRMTDDGIGQMEFWLERDAALAALAG